ncbi:MAG: Trm112 family protein [Gammaproteobacteria bacterium]|nr:Trm112 family protein [Gammaproteobacteria bacterium]
MDKRLLAILVCPANKTPLHYDSSKQELISLSAGLAYPIRDGIPILLVNEARTLSLEEAEAYRKQSQVTE